MIHGPSKLRSGSNFVFFLFKSNYVSFSFGENTMNAQYHKKSPEEIQYGNRYESNLFGEQLLLQNTVT
jgi:hypothetical protein